MEAYGGCNQEETSLEKHCPGMQNAKSKLSWNWNWWVMWTAMRRAFTGTLQPKWEPRISRELTDIEHEKGSSTQCLLHLGLHWQDQAFWVSVPSGRWEVLPTTAEEDLSRDHLANLTHTKKSMGPGGVLQSVRWETRPKSSQGFSPSCLKKHGNLVRSPWQERQMSHLFSKRGRKRIQITKGQSDSPQSMERL